ncbi:uncharacterized protein [Nicotiana tomentosiformis]|uniref:uncharacterized protein n=1 Tax=Nicotiana tomentosiformis TaxID=4098 RepID=UPI00388CB882
MAQNKVSSLEHSPLLFLQVADAPGLVLVPIKLTGPQNYALWSRAMKQALLGKSKLGFVDGTCVKNIFRGELPEQWEKCNAIVLSWIGSSVAVKLMPSIMFASSAKKVWSDFQESYSNVRSNVLLKRPVVTVNKAYVIVTQEESQRSLGIGDVNRDPLTMLAGRAQSFKPKKTRLVYEHCGYKWHLKENYYKIVGYPSNFKSNKKPVGIEGRTYVNNAAVEESNIGGSLPQGHFLIEEQYK